MKKIGTFILFFTSLLLMSCLGNDGQDGLNSLLLTSLEPAGTNCPTGGLKVDSGLDSNANGVLDTDEILTTNYICSGVNSLINVFDELAGGDCANGGIRIETGIDTNGNGNLDAEEIQVTRFLCNLDGGGFDEQIRLSFGIQNAPGTINTSGDLIGELPNFNKHFWSGVDSIVFVPRFWSRHFNTNPNNIGFAEVFDVTNNNIINNSLISTNEQEIFGQIPPFLYSSNIYDNLPEEEVTLSVLLRTETQNQVVAIYGPAYLFLYRRH